MGYVVFTCVTGDHDELRPATVRPPGLDFVCYTDRPCRVEGWDVRPLYCVQASPRATARWHKLHPHRLFPYAEYTLWMDGTHALLADLHDWPQKFLRGHDLACYRHPFCYSTRDEVRAILSYGKDHAERVNSQYLRQILDGFPDQTPHFETTILLRRQTPLTIQHGEFWWSCLEHGSLRDQLSFTYALWRTGCTCAELAPGYAAENPYFVRFPHGSAD